MPGYGVFRWITIRDISSMAAFLRVVSIVRRGLRRIAVGTLRGLSAPLPRREQSLSRSPLRILVIQTGYVGDAVLLTPTVAALKKEYPDATLDLVLRPSQAAVFAADPRVGKVHCFGRSFIELPRLGSVLRAERYDVAVDVQGELKTALIALASGAPDKVGFNVDGAGFLLTHELDMPDMHMPEAERKLYAVSPLLRVGDHDTRLSLFVPAEARERAARMLPWEGFAVVHPGAGWASKRWAPGRFADLIRGLARDLRVAVTGGPKDAARNREVLSGVDTALDLTGKTSILELAAVLQSAKVIISADTAVSHIGRAVGTPTVSLYGPTDPTRYGPTADLERHRIISARKYCLCPDAKVCRFGDKSSVCMQQIEVREVLEAVRAVLGR